MTYVFLVAGKGTRLSPITCRYPKSLFKLDKNTTVLERAITQIKKYDKNAEIIVVDGFMKEEIEREIENVTFIFNPFYSITNSIASLWFAKHKLENVDNLAIINGDVVLSDKLVENILCKETEKPFVLVDGSIKNEGDYNVQINSDKVLVMSKELSNYYGEYAGVTKLDKRSKELLLDKVMSMIKNDMHDQWYEDALVQMIFEDDFDLYYKDISNYDWTEVDTVDDLMEAKRIHLNDMKQVKL